MRSKTLITSVRTLPILIFLLCNFSCHAQKPEYRQGRRDSTLFLKSALSITQNGFSFIPSFSLGKPAVIFEPAIGNKRLSFEPQFRFALEGKPWSFLFIFRYKVINKRKFYLQLGGHIPTINFTNEKVVRNGVSENVMVSHRFLTVELIPNYTLSKKVTLAMYFLRGHGFDTGIHNTYFAGFRTPISNINIVGRLYMKTTPMIYYLRTDDNHGTYITNNLTVGLRNFPFSVSNIVNKAFKTSIPGKDFDWNVSLIYTIDKNYILR
jgi:hypothetical protein